MLILVTGLPGNGKTLYALNWVKAKAEREGRPVFYSGIADLRLPWAEIPDATRWVDCPANALIVIDEAQRVFRNRMHGQTVPEHVSALETHRHKGVDLVLITQHPMLIDNAVRRLAGLHFHVVRKFGMAASTVHEWASVKENCDKSRTDSTRHEFRYPKDAYAWYKSAEVHTHKARIPFRVWLLLCLPLFIGAAVYAGWRWFKTPVAVAASGQVAAGRSASGSVVGGGAGSRSAALTASEYVEQFTSRVRGLAYTAPIYDEVTRPVHAPYPAACVASASVCACYTQQGTALADVPAALCAQIVASGFFVAWAVERPQAPALPSSPDQQHSEGGRAAGRASPPGGMGAQRPMALPEAAGPLAQPVDSPPWRRNPEARGELVSQGTPMGDGAAWNIR